MEKNKIVECYCCHNEYKYNEIVKICVTTSGKCRDGTNAEDRFVCKKCNRLKNSKVDKKDKK